MNGYKVTRLQCYKVASLQIQFSRKGAQRAQEFPRKDRKIKDRKMRKRLDCWISGLLDFRRGCRCDRGLCWELDLPLDAGDFSGWMGGFMDFDGMGGDASVMFYR